jgi:hypothetical protein
MRMADRVNIGTHLIEKQVHAGFRGDFPVALQVTALHVHDNEVARRHHALIQASGSGEDALCIEANGQVAFAGNDVAAFI